MARPVIALLTDFGLSDHYVAAMKGVILGICPDVTLLDITHDIPPQDILAGAIELEAVAPYLPDRTIVVGVVDPGVGSARRGVAIQTHSGLRCVGPDNGLFTLVAGETPPQAVEITSGEVTRATISRTFEGRDRFAPVAAWLASGIELRTVGPAVEGLSTLAVPAPVVDADGVLGEVLRVDRFGNLVTNVRADMLERLGDDLVALVDDAHRASVVATYADNPAGTTCALVGSTGRLEIAVSCGNAATTLGVTRGASVRVRRR